MAVESKPLMPKATAVWLVDNTSLTFEQIADFCGLHPLEVKGIADEDVAKGIKGQDPVTSGQLTREQIEEAEKNPKARLKMAPPKHKMPAVKQKKAPRYTPVSKRQDKPDAVYWILRNHPEFADADIIKLIGTTKATIQKIRERSHWNATNIKAVDPVTLGLCSQLELDLAVTRAGAKRDRALKRAEKAGANSEADFGDDGRAGFQARRSRSARIPAGRRQPGLRGRLFVRAARIELGRRQSRLLRLRLIGLTVDIRGLVAHGNAHNRKHRHRRMDRG